MLKETEEKERNTAIILAATEALEAKLA
jgi:hypothetical protein